MEQISQEGTEEKSWKVIKFYVLSIDNSTTIHFASAGVILNFK
jgi:hypothetical protein